jgi:hypothetical protein
MEIMLAENLNRPRILGKGLVVDFVYLLGKPSTGRRRQRSLRETSLQRIEAGLRQLLAGLTSFLASSG